MKTSIILPDIHYPEHSTDSIKLVLAFIKDLKPDEVIYQGDNLDMGVISHWNKDKKRKLELKRLIEDYNGFDRDVLIPIEKAAGNKTKFVWLTGNHECLDEETDVLTERGWLRYDEVKKDSDKVFSYNPETNTGEFVRIDNIIEHEFDGMLNRIKTATIDLLATDDHKIFSMENGNPKYTEIRNLSKTRYHIPVCTNTDYEKIILDSFEKSDKNFTKEHYKGIVWDLTVKNHNFMVRRNGKYHFTGNCWGDQYLEKNPELTGMIEPEIVLKLKKRRYKIIPFNGVYKTGKLNIIHGMYHSKYHASKTLDVFEENVCYGHMHSPQMQAKVKLLDSNKFTAAYCLPCLSTLSPEYLKGKPNAWINGFGVLYTLPNGDFNLYTILIHNNKFIFNGKLYKI